MGRKLTEEHKRKISEAIRAKQVGRTEKLCPKCGVTLPLFHFDERQNGFLESYCRPCKRSYATERQRNYYNQNPTAKTKAAKSNRRTKLKSYGLTEDQYADIFKRQGCRCAICGTSEPGKGHRHMPVDHDHNTGVVRGILCHNCNRAIGLLGDSLKTVRAAVSYLKARTQQRGDVATNNLAG